MSRSWLRVPLASFEQHLSELKNVATFVTPEELLEPAPFRERRVLLTFDDGFVSHFQMVLPLLRRYRIPALFFVSTWHMLTLEPFWFDRIAVPIQAGGLRLLDLRDLQLGVFHFRDGDSSHRWDDINRLMVALKLVGNPGHPVVDTVIRRLAESPSAPSGQAFGVCRPLSATEMATMYASGLCHFGSHGHRHEILTTLSDIELARSIATSRDYLANAIHKPVKDIAYPNGDCDERVLAAVSRAGFTRGYTVRDGLVRRGSAPLTLPRLQVGGFDSLETLFTKINRLLLKSFLPLRR